MIGPGFFILILLAVGAIMTQSGAVREYRDIVLALLIGFAGLAASIAIAVLIGRWSPIAGWIFVFVAVLFVFDRMIKD